MMQHVLVSKRLANIVQGIDLHPGFVDTGSIEDVARFSTGASVVCSTTTATASVRVVLPTAEQICWDLKDSQAHAMIALSIKEYKVKKDHAADKHSKVGHMFDEEMEHGGKFYDVEMHEVATRSFQGMSNEVQSDKLDEDKDTTTRAHEEVNDRREEPDHEVLPDQQDVDKEHPDKDQQDIDKDQKVEVDDENLLSENKDGDKDSIKEDPKVDMGGNKVSKEEDTKVDTDVSKEPLEECLHIDEEVHKAQFLGEKDPPTGVDVNEHTPSDDDAPLAEMFCIKKKLSQVRFKAWWLDESTIIDRNPPEDILASKGRLIILDVNGVVLKGWSRLPNDEWELQHALQGIRIRVNNFCLVKLRPGAQDFLEALAARASIMIWSCCMKPKLMQILKNCFSKVMKNPKIIKDIFSQEDCEIWRDSFKCVPYIDAKFWQKPIFLKKLQRVWGKHPQFNASNTILLEDTRYKSLKNDYDNCLFICSFDSGVKPEGSSYLADIIKPWLLEWIRAPYPLFYCRKHSLFDVEHDLSPLVAEYFVAMEGYLYRFDPSNM
ncbi:hypothetical protein L7F22_006686 [Adiantum nelumboides]|nr:hypothetical protein [Adiantum nelumboides]